MVRYVRDLQLRDVGAGPPSRPEGPLEVSDVKAESVKLKWKKPKDDGGKDIM